MIARLIIGLVALAALIALAAYSAQPCRPGDRTIRVGGWMVAGCEARP